MEASRPANGERRRVRGVEGRGAVNGEESKWRTEQNGDDALWRKMEKMNNANGSTVRREREEGVRGFVQKTLHRLYCQPI